MEVLEQVSQSKEKAVCIMCGNEVNDTYIQLCENEECLQRFLNEFF